MKKIIAFMLLASILFLSGCAKKDESSSTSPAPSEESGSSYVPPEEFYWQYGFREAYFNSIHGLIKGLLTGFTEEVLRDIKAEEGRRGIKGGTYRTFLQEFIKKNQLVVPYYKGQEIPLENLGEGAESITIHYQSLFSRSWFWYRGLAGDDSVEIRTMYIDDALVKEANEKGVPWLISTIAPNSSTPEYPNLDNYKGKKFVKTMYESKLQLDGFSVDALIREDNDEEVPRHYVHFVHDNVFVIVRIYPDAFERGILKDLSFKSVPLK